MITPPLRLTSTLIAACMLAAAPVSSAASGPASYAAENGALHPGGGAPNAANTPTLTESALKLPSGNVWSIAQGPQGYLWFATDGGLAVDVGGEDPLVVDTVIVDGKNPTSAAVTSVVPAANEGVLIADGHLKHASVWVNTVTDTGVPADTVIRVEGDLWAVQGSTARLVDGSSYNVKQTIDLDLLDVRMRPSPATADSEGTLYVADRRDLVRATSEGAVERIGVGDTVTGMTPRRSGGVWFSTPSGLGYVGPHDNTPTTTVGPHPTAVGVPPTAALLELVDGRVLVGLGNGSLGVFAPSAQSWVNTDDKRLITRSAVERVFQDHDDRVWLAMADRSVMRFRDSNPYQVIELPVMGPTGPPIVRSLITHDGALWAAFGPEGLARYNNVDDTWAWPIQFAENTDGARTPPSVSGLASFDGELWIGTDGQGLYRASEADGTVEQVTGGVADSTTDLVVGPTGLFFLSDRDDGVHRVDHQGQVHHIAKVVDVADTDRVEGSNASTDSSTPKPATATAPTTAIGEGQGSLFATDSEGLWKYDEATDKLHRIVNLEGRTRWSTATSSMFVESSNVVWVGSDTGVQRVDVASGQIRNYTVENGLPPGAVTTLLPHSDGAGLWVGAASGLVLIDLNSSEVVASVGPDQGLESNQFIDAKGVNRDDGHSLLATSENIVVLPIGRPESQDTVRFQVRCSDGCDSQIGEAPTVKDSDRLKFEFITPEGEQARTMPVEYRLAGQEHEWTIVDPDKRSASYSRLSPGNYTIEVRSALGARSSASGGSTTTPHATISFEVRQDWWRRPWTLILLALAVAGAVWAAVVMYTRRRRMHERLLERTVQERTADLEKSRLHAEFANRAKDRFLMAVTHDLRSPLGGVIGYSELIGNTNLDDEQRRYVDAIDRAGRTLFDLVEDLLFQSSNLVGSGHRAGEPAQVQEVVHQAARFVATHASTESIRIIEHADSDDTVIVDARGLKHVLVSLLMNAVKYSGGTQIDISVRAGDYDPERKLRSYLFSVTDDGGRLTPDSINEIFAEGKRGPEISMSGGGLGLQLCREWVRANGGELTASVDPGYSTTLEFSLSLPAAAPDEASTATAPPRQSVSSAPRQDEGDVRLDAQKPLVLVVDDEPMVRGLLTTMVTQLGYRFCAYDNAVDALRFLMTENGSGSLPTVIISDLMMEPMSGEDFARQIRDSLLSKVPPIIAVTGVPAEAESAGVFDVVIGKPVRTRDLKDVLDDLAPLPMGG